MSSALPGESRAHTASVVVLGADAVLAALPATPVQLAHACLRAGYHTVVPASWGDELLATETLRQLRERGREPAVFCACPHVGNRLLGVGSDLAPFLVSLIPPPIATARYLRALSGDAPIRITYVGRCPSASDSSLDAQFSPMEFLATLTDRDISLRDQPMVFDALLSPDRRRSRSLPGGLPTPELLWTAGGGRTLVELDGDDPAMPAQLAQHLFAHDCVLLDLATSLGCACTGAISTVPPRGARAAVTALEPPRAPTPTVDTDVRVALTVPILITPRQPATAAPSEGSPAPEPGRTSQPPDGAESAAEQRATPSPRRRSPAIAVMRHAPASLPLTTRVEGRPLPRAYVARRRPASRLADAEPQGAIGSVGDNGAAYEGTPALENTAPGGDSAEPVTELPARADVATVPYRSYRLLEHPRHLVMLIVGIVIISIALGIAAGASLRLQSSTADRPSETTRSSRGGMEELAPPEGRSMGSAAGVAALREAPVTDTFIRAPLESRQSTGDSAAAAPARWNGVPVPAASTRSREVPVRLRSAEASDADGTARRAIAALAASAPVLRSVVLGVRAETGLWTPRLAPPGAERDAFAERAALDLELEIRRARLDSLARVVDSLESLRRPPPH